MKKRDRMGYIGASEAAAALGFSPWKTKVELWEEKTGRVGEPPTNVDMERGNRFEEEVLRLAREEGMEIIDEQAEFTECIGEWLTLKCHVDGIIKVWTEIETSNVPMDGPGVVECKAPRGISLRKMQDNGLSEDYIVQMQVMLHLTKLKWGRYLLYDYDNQRNVAFDVRADEEFALAVVKGLEAFWDSVVSDTAPLEEEKLLDVPAVDGLTFDIVGDESVQYLIDEYLAVKRSLDAAQETMEKARAQLIENALCHSKVRFNHALQLTQTVVTPKPSIDGNKLAEFTATMAACLVDGDDDHAKLMAEKYDLGTFQKDRKPYKRVLITELNKGGK